MKNTHSCSPLAVFLLAVFAALIGVVPSIAQDDAQRKSELGVRQRLIELKMLELETKLTVIAEKTSREGAQASQAVGCCLSAVQGKTDLHKDGRSKQAA